MSETLVVVSKIKAFIKKESDMSTSANVMPKITEIIENECRKAMENAKKAGRKTVMDRDFEE